jgi:hypothetical protein
MTMAHNCILADHDMLGARIAACCLFICEMETGHMPDSHHESGEGIGS